MAKEAVQEVVSTCFDNHAAESLPKFETYVKSPVASGWFACSSLMCLVRVMMSVLMFSLPTAPPWEVDMIAWVFGEVVKIREGFGYY